jgi:deazaflavin-dependent oxidoreductase (nitroreductase family)
MSNDADRKADHLDPAGLDLHLVCHLTTTGRVTGRRHTIEIWFAHHQGAVYLLSGGGRRSDWVRNIVRSPQVTVGAGGRSWLGRARIIDDPAEAGFARNLVHDRYRPRYAGDLTGWRDGALPIAIDLEGNATS